MLLMLHIGIALASLGIATTAAFRPALGTLKLSGAMIIATLGSGVVLVVVNPKTALTACISGIVYLTIVSIVTLYAFKKHTATQTT